MILENMCILKFDTVNGQSSNRDMCAAMALLVFAYAKYNLF